MNFAEKLNTAILKKESRLCVGLDPRLEWLPTQLLTAIKKEHGSTFTAAGKAITRFNEQVIDAVHSTVPAVKLQIAFYEQYGPAGLQAFWDTIRYAKKHQLVVLVDAKRGDIDSTAQAYANSLLGETNLFGKQASCYDVDCITVNPFLGEDSLLPFIETVNQYGKGIFILVKTSNPGSTDLQDLIIDGENISFRVAELVNKHAQANRHNNSYADIGAVVGATFPEQAKALRSLMPNSIFLVPGLGTQGGAMETLQHFFNPDGLGAIVNSSRDVVFSYTSDNEKDFQKVIARRAKDFTAQIQAAMRHHT